MSLTAAPIEFYWFNTRLRLGTDYTRYFEYPKVLELLQIPDTGTPSLLDVGSGRRGQFPLFVASRFPHVAVCATDPREDFFEQKRFVTRLGLDQALASGRLRLEPMDILHPSFPEGSFDRISCISTIEHIPDDGDTVAIQEMARLLRPGGRLVLSVPFNLFRNGAVHRRAAAYRIPGREANAARNFFERIYDAEALEQRLIGPSGLSAERILYFGEPGFSLGRLLHRGERGKGVLSRLFFRSYVPHVLMPVLSPLFLKEITPEQFDAEDWTGVGAVVALRKPA